MDAFLTLSYPLLHDTRLQERRRSESGSIVEGDEGEDGRSVRSKDSLARTARRSEWGHSKIFDDDEDEDDEMQVRGRRDHARGTCQQKGICYRLAQDSDCVSEICVLRNELKRSGC